MADERFLNQIRSELERVDPQDDESRLRTLEDLYRSLEDELEGDIDQAGPPRH